MEFNLFIKKRKLDKNVIALINPKILMYYST